MDIQRMTVRLFALVLLSAAGVLSGCAASSATKVTLLPDQSGHVGAVTVSDAQGEQRIDRAFDTVAVEPSTAPGAPRASDRQAFEKDHRALLDAQPTPPRSFTLNFLFDSMALTPESKQQLPEVLQSVRDRSPTEVTVYGYADSSGTAAYNMALSAQRAQAVARLLKQIDPKLPMDVRYFGDKAPLVPTGPGAREPRNRRAEIVVL
ncbi:outer membrane protein OmpA-like peptidoglycan-associated protein [Rhodanobacter sp. K2T2]|uniref:OmpA family protein n=1 Tax=Rhodanobacter sp. K2T2 TaxID=2723085 RepID=UPI0015C8B6F1|nr:OmpA family protein [Rhodanobacter sp. K2T2]NYE31096.1 outer membrane protein OmpA-like peptidoglycan-associated protein [Rhodanobacter sp. K2T2]